MGEAGVAQEQLERLSETLLLPNAVTDEAIRICIKGLQRGLARRRPLAQVAASSLYASCRAREVPATLREVAAAGGVSRIVLASCYRLLVGELDLKIPVADPAECLAKVASRAGVGPKVEADAREILVKAAKAGMTAGVYPAGLAAAAIYLAALLDGRVMTQREAAEAAGVREATVRKQYKRLRKVVGGRIERRHRKRRFCLSELESNRPSRVEVPA